MQDILPLTASRKHRNSGVSWTFPLEVQVISKSKSSLSQHGEPFMDESRSAAGQRFGRAVLILSVAVDSTDRTCAAVRAGRPEPGILIGPVVGFPGPARSRRRSIPAPGRWRRCVGGRRARSQYLRLQRGCVHTRSLAVRYPARPHSGRRQRGVASFRPTKPSTACRSSTNSAARLSCSCSM